MGDIILVAIVSCIIWLIWMWWVSQPTTKKKKNDDYYDPYEKPKNTERIELDPNPKRWYPTPTFYYIDGGVTSRGYESLNELEDSVIENPEAPLTTAEFVDMLPDQPEIPAWLMADIPKPRLIETDNTSKK